MATFQPAYIETKKKGLLRDKISKARDLLKSCEICPRACKVDRLSGELGFCSTGEEAVVSSFNAHFGEEPPLVGAFGSGTIFFTHCNLKCNFLPELRCQSRGGRRGVWTRTVGRHDVDPAE